jgi:hypothetical protein
MVKNTKYFIYSFKLILSFITLIFIAINNNYVSANDFFTIDNINIEIVSEDINLARQDATQKAMLLGFKRLLSWKLSSQDFTFIESIFNKSDENLDIKNFVTGYKIHYENLSNINYKAEFSVFYDLTKIGTWLSNHNTSFFEKRVVDVLNIPIITMNNKIILWDVPNPWSFIWKKYFSNKDVVNFLYSNGDIEDVVNLSYDDLFDFNLENIHNFSDRYDLINIFIPYIQVKKDLNNNYDAILNANLIMDKDIINLAKDIQIKSYEDELFDDFLIRASNLIFINIKNYWNKNQIYNIKTLYLNANFNNFQNWRLLISNLKNMDEINEYKILSLSYEKALIQIKINIENEATLFKIFNKYRIDIQKSLKVNEEYNISLIHYNEENLNLLDSSIENQKQKKESSILLAE